jgi:hypothetical protein
VMSANLYTEAEFSDLIVQARARLVVVRPDGCLPASSGTKSSWCALYCVAAPAAPEARRDSGALRIYGLRHGTTFIDAANWHLRPPFGAEHHVYRLAPGEIAAFPASMQHEVALNRADSDIILVTMRVRFAHRGQTAAPPW